MQSDASRPDDRGAFSGASRGVLAELMRTIAERKANPSEKSYTSKLLAGGVPKIGAKVTEEAAEAVEAAGEPGDAGRDHLIREAADVVYHLFVLLLNQGLTPDAVWRTLGSRHAASQPASEAGAE